MSIVHVKINGIPVEVEAGTTILLAARKAGVTIPTLCYHDDLKPFGSCGLCIVKQEGNAKILRACATPAAEHMSIITHDPELYQVRKTILEMILSTHPSSCLTCIRNGECELQTLAAEFGIREQPFDVRLSDRPKDTSSASIVLDPEKCIKCGRCVQVCQDLQGVFALEFIGRGDGTCMAPAAMLQLEDSPCVRCGQCAAHCPVGAIYEKDEVAAFQEAVADPEKQVVVQIAPSIRVGLSESFGLPAGTVTTGKIYAALRRLGVDAVHDTNFGADLTIMEEGSELVHRLTKGGALPQFTSCCPAWVDYVEKYYPDLLDMVSSAKSPMQMVGAVEKTYTAEKQNMDPAKMYTVAIMPCTAKKYEAYRDESMRSSGYQDVDLVLTTREFARLIKATGIDFLHLEEEAADNPVGEYSGAGTIFGATGGVMEAAVRTAYHVVTGKELENVEIESVRGLDEIKKGTVDFDGTPVRVAVVHGLSHVAEVLDEVRAARAEGKQAPYEFIEVMACRGGCIAGGGQPYGATDVLRTKRAAGLYSDDKQSKVRCSHQNESIKQLYEEFLDKPLSKKSHHLLHTTYQEIPVYKA
ncbi:MAG: NADH-quinone oxidoreductase subunit [Sphaerochaeta sp.]|uniref:Ferredoxin n=3 Tax=Sphaerochaeta TaxID=399320 RepID=A0A372MK24_9SPIR|nr:NADH-dependent [FeFe] hydrogenase, group A6 [Sphaerochaeta halotolerans]MBG0766487.1 iron hydrogenase small subunit [Spirochaetaceae bacterium]MDK2859250.1 NADH-quinone oxidoreductase subunit [Sphaerochaeta sp.]MDN5332831.1 NADH-quinone oxidoreductase subunit [Sphaerochaeta sp.]RFU95738.1 ferredoxin [Sphaerochaeta halotolerans]